MNEPDDIPNTTVDVNENYKTLSSYTRRVLAHVDGGDIKKMIDETNLLRAVCRVTQYISVISFILAFLAWMGWGPSFFREINKHFNGINDELVISGFVFMVIYSWLEGKILVRTLLVDIIKCKSNPKLLDEIIVKKGSQNK